MGSPRRPVSTEHPIAGTVNPQRSPSAIIAAMDSHSEQRHDAIVVGAGLAGLVAASELVAAGRRVLVLDQEPEASLGGQAHWSFGGLFLVDSPEHRRLRVRDSADRAWADWQHAAGFDREADEDAWAAKWARRYVEWAAGPKREWLHAMGVRWFPVVGWAERGAMVEGGYGNSVPRFHVTWGTGPGVVAPFLARAREAERAGTLTFAFRHRVDGIVTRDGAAAGVHGAVLEPSSVARSEDSSRVEVGEFSFEADAVVVASGGIGGNHDLVRAQWPERLGAAPARMVSGVPAHVDGRMLDIAARAGGRLVNGDRMWHYTEGIENWAPVWTRHGIRILPGPSSIWLDSRGDRLPEPLYPGYDTLDTLAHITRGGHPHTWFILTQKIIEKEFALSGSEQNPDLTGKSIRQVLKRVLPGAPGPVEAFKQRGADFVVRDSLEELVAAMNDLADGSGAPALDAAHVRTQVEARDADIGSDHPADPQVAGIDRARRYLGDKLIRTASPHRILDPKAGPLIAVRLHVLTRKSLGGLQTDLESRVLDAAGQPIAGLYAAGEAAGFGGGGMHGYRSLEGTFLGGCLFTGRAAGRAVAAQLG
ncbi:MAG: fumarate reductase/succinate dehydrogenase flavoprotein domain protein [Thermoleophilia bacterium]|nr:fumarate reductase/succinate dehydrogenase flavoprotein domain protein [Thermoleophilia bacterium]